MNIAIKNEVNKLIEDHKLVMLEFIDGKVNWLYKHYTHIDPEDSLRVRLGFSPPPTTVALRESNRNKGVKILYLTEKL